MLTIFEIWGHVEEKTVAKLWLMVNLHCLLKSRLALRVNIFRNIVDVIGERIAPKKYKIFLEVEM